MKTNIIKSRQIHDRNGEIILDLYILWYRQRTELFLKSNLFSGGTDFTPAVPVIWANNALWSYSLPDDQWNHAFSQWIGLILAWLTYSPYLSLNLRVIYMLCYFITVLKSISLLISHLYFLFICLNWAILADYVC